jgi:hypothetical protein
MEEASWPKNPLLAALVANILGKEAERPITGILDVPTRLRMREQERLGDTLASNSCINGSGVILLLLTC